MPKFESWLKLYSSMQLDIRIRAATRILDHSDDAPLDLLIDILKSLGNHGLGAKAEQVLLKRQDADLVPKMIGLLESHDHLVRETACTVLGHSGDFSATPHLLRMIDDPKLMVRRAAGFGLAVLKDESAVEALREQLQHHQHDDVDVVAGIRCALKSIGWVFDHEDEGASQIEGLGDTIRLYEARAYECLATAGFERELKNSENRMAEVFLLPSFHPETLIRVSLQGLTTQIRIATLTKSLWYFEQERLHPEMASTGSTREPPVLIEERHDVPSFDAEGFWKDMDELLAEGVQSTSSFGCDGMPVRGMYGHGDIRKRFESWSPNPDSPQGHFVGLLYKLAWNSITNRTLVERFEQLHGYLELGLPIRWVVGNKKCLRIFGGLTASDEPELRRVLSAIPQNEHLIVDMSNFEGMGTILYLVFREFASAHPNMVWICSKMAEKQLRALGVDESKIRCAEDQSQ